MKRAIEFSEIRKGDLIRAENRSASGRGGTAHEFRATSDGDHDGWVLDRFDWFLLDRPEPAIELPTEPTLGWVTWTRRSSFPGKPILAVWQLHGPADSSDGDLRQVDSVGKSSGGDPSTIDSFVAATAVPTEALEALREEVNGWSHLDPNSIVSRFLAAVDKAGESA